MDLLGGVVENKKVVKVVISDKEVDGIVVGVIESLERFSEVKLEDGTTIKTKMNTVEAIRLDGQWDTEGNPIYHVKSQNLVVVTKSPENLKSPESLKRKL